MKMRLFFNSGLIAVLAAMLLFGLPCSAQEGAIEQIRNAGSIDWVSRKLTATGIGVPTKKAVSRGQMRAMVIRAAKVVARRNLLEVVKGVHIDSNKLTYEIRERDRLNSERAIAPLKKAEDALHIDTSDMTFDEQVEAIISFVCGDNRF